MLRVAGDEYRPLLRPPRPRRALPAVGWATYDDVATLTVATDGRRPEAVCQDVVARLLRAPAVPEGTSTVLVSCTGGTYNVYVGAGLLSEVDRLLPALPYARTAVLLAPSADDPAAAR